MEDIDHLLIARPLASDPRPGTRPLESSVLGVLGIELVVARSDRVVARMPAPETGRCSLFNVLAETVASTAAGLAAGPRRRAFGMLLETTHLASARGDIVIAEATPLMLDADRHAWSIGIFDQSGVRCASGRCQLRIVDAPGA